jgi:hypothetical protein
MYDIFNDLFMIDRETILHYLGERCLIHMMD